MFLRFFVQKIPQVEMTCGIFYFAKTGQPPCLPPFGRLRLGGLLVSDSPVKVVGLCPTPCKLFEKSLIKTFTPLRGHRGR